MDDSQADRIQQLKAFDDTKSGVKGLIDAAAGGVVKIPKIFIRPPDELAEDLQHTRTTTLLRVPTIDLKGNGSREKIVEQVKQASQEWGFFQVINHGIPMQVLQEMLNGVRQFNEQDIEAKKYYYSRDPERMVKFNTNYDFYMSRAANWRDMIRCLSTCCIRMNFIHTICPLFAEIVLWSVDYLNHLMKLVDTLFEFLSEALGLDRNHLKQLECHKSRTLACHYYPACPNPDLTLGVNKHTDASFITILLQDDVGGLEVLHGNEWAGVEPIHGALIVNIGDLL